MNQEWIKRDFYKDLDLDSSASEADIKKSYKKLVSKFHPDKNPGNKQAEERFKNISSAYNVIGDKDKKREYDTFRENLSSNGSYPNWANKRGDSVIYRKDNDKFSRVIFDIIEEEFKNTDFFSKPKVMIDGQDVMTRLSIDFNESIYGTTKKILLANNKYKKIKIPKGVMDGQKIRFKGLGEQGINGGNNGNLILLINVKNDTDFSLFNGKLLKVHKVDVIEAITGGKSKITDFYGKTIEFVIPEGIESGEKMILKNKGIKTKNGKRDDLIIEIETYVPKKITPEQKKILKQFRKTKK